ncbi:hypothetical protein [Comamonas sp. JC664]|uniref:hypothetical protein n=1 Tax=Comamonas sp. JC664 TaxID=2801917 RepID=UPI00360B79B9
MISPAGQNQWSKIGGGSASVTAAKLGDLNPQTWPTACTTGPGRARYLGNETSAKVTVAITESKRRRPCS